MCQIQCILVSKTKVTYIKVALDKCVEETRLAALVISHN